jgi:hypothetical protein
MPAPSSEHHRAPGGGRRHALARRYDLLPVPPMCLLWPSPVSLSLSAASGGLLQTSYAGVFGPGLAVAPSSGTVVARKRWQTRTNKGGQCQGAAAASSNNIPILELHRPIFLPGKMSFCSAIFFKATFQIVLEEKKMMLS